MQNSCYKCEFRYIGCHSTCVEYREYCRVNEAKKQFLRLDEAEQHLIDNNKGIQKYLEVKRKKSKRVGIW